MKAKLAYDPTSDSLEVYFQVECEYEATPRDTPFVDLTEEEVESVIAYRAAKNKYNKIYAKYKKSAYYRY